MTARNKKEFQPGQGYTKDDWDAVDSPELTDEELKNLRPAKEVLPPAFFNSLNEVRRTRGRPRVDAPKEAVTLRLDPETLRRFKAIGKNWRAKMAEILNHAKL